MTVSVATMVFHRWDRYEPAYLWECVPPELPGCGASDRCPGCGEQVTDEEICRLGWTSIPPWSFELSLVVAVRDQVASR